MTWTEEGVLRETRDLLESHGLEGWTVMWDNDDMLAGGTNGNLKRITFSRVMLAGRSEEVMRETILHEVAHALAPSNSHDDDWLEILIGLGGTGAEWEDMP